MTTRTARPSDPIHQFEEAWYFWDETWLERVGAWATEAEAREALDKYCREVLGFTEEEIARGRAQANQKELALVVMDEEIMSPQKLTKEQIEHLRDNDDAWENMGWETRDKLCAMALAKTTDFKAALKIANEWLIAGEGVPLTYYIDNPAERTVVEQALAET